MLEMARVFHQRKKSVLIYLVAASQMQPQNLMENSDGDCSTVMACANYQKKPQGLVT